MGLVMETDIGRDADDLFALLYFLGAGIPLQAICVSPGDWDQVAIVKAVVKQFGLNIPVLSPEAREPKLSITPFHRWVLNQLGETDWVEPDGHEKALPTEPVEVFVCGPIKMAHRLNPTRITVQGGFVPYSKYRPRKTLAKFEGLERCRTFNLGGTKPAVSEAVINASAPHRFVGKNVCHTILYTPEIHDKYCPKDGPIALRLHKMAVEQYLQEKGAKAFHDPLAAILHNKLELGVWMGLKPVRVSGEYGVEDADPVQYRSLVDLMDEPWTSYFDGLMGKIPAKAYE